MRRDPASHRYRRPKKRGGAEGFGINIAKDGNDALPLQCMGGGDAVPDPEIVFEFLLEAEHQLAVVGEPAAVEHGIDVRLEQLPVSNVWSAYVQWLPKFHG